jgi:predicted O-methyltransferase YrrM
VTVQPGLARYARAVDFPPLVWATVEASRALGGEKACLPETGRLLRTLAAAQPPGARLGETGTACGVAAAWLASGMQPGSTLATVELDARLADAAAAALDRAEGVRVLAGDWRELRPLGPFDLLFCDGGPDKADPDQILDLLAPGGLLVIDDLTPTEASSDQLRAAFPNGDPVRRAWSARGDVVATEVLVTPVEAVLLAARR